MNLCQYLKPACNAMRSIAGRPISISLSPNTEKDDIFLALKLIFSAIGGPAFGGQPWRDGPAIKELEEEFKKYLGVKNAISFNSGRSSLMAILNALNLEPNSEILIQAFTCNAVANPIIWSGFKPVYVDCNEKTFNIDVEDLKKKITLRSRVIIVQHTFGLPADMDEILKICQENNLILIEDCAHSLGAEYGSTSRSTLRVSDSMSSPQVKGKKVGTFGKLAFFSFSRDKIISSVYGGIVVTNNKKLAEKIKTYQEEIGYPSYCWVFQQLLHPVLMNWLILPTYKIFGKYLLILFQWLHILSKAVHWKEKRGRKPGYFPKRLPNALAILALNQFKKLERFNEHRKEIAAIYTKELYNTKYEMPTVHTQQDTKYENGHIFLRFPVRHEKAHEIIKNAWQQNILIGDWYTTPIAPHDTQLYRMQYLPGSCPTAEKLAKETFNLPTHINISQNDAQEIINFLNRSI